MRTAREKPLGQARSSGVAAALAIVAGALAASAASLAETAAAQARAFYTMGEPDWSQANDSPPVWSRDGGEILFQQTREEGRAQIWAVRPDGTGLRRITDGAHRDGHPDPCALDDRLVLVSDRDGTRQIWALETASGAMRQLTRGGEVKKWPAWSPDCREILFVENRDAETGHDDLRVVDVSTGALRSLIEDVRYLGWSRWSPDGEWIYYYRELEGYPNHLWRIRRDGSVAEQLTRGDHGDYWSPDPSRDGRLLSFAFGRRRQLAWDGNADLWLLDVESGVCRPLADAWWHENGQRLSPDGRRLVYWDSRTGYEELHVLDLATGADRELTSQPPTELTRIARERGAEAALAYARARRGDVLFAESGMTALFADWARGGQPPEVALARHFAERHPESRRARLTLARELFRAGELVASRELYRALRSDAPADPAVTARLTTLALVEETTGTALDELAMPLPERQVNLLGYALLRLERLDEAVDVFGWNVRTHPESANAYDSFGEALYWRGELDAARRAYERALELDSTNVNAERFLDRIRSAREGRGSAGDRSDRVPCPSLRPVDRADPPGTSPR